MKTFKEILTEVTKNIKNWKYIKDEYAIVYLSKNKDIIASINKDDMEDGIYRIYYGKYVERHKEPNKNLDFTNFTNFKNVNDIPKLLDGILNKKLDKIK